jgi:glycosyltransferase involved in cell wall biosynthesis
MSRYPLDVLFFPASYSFVPVFTRATKLVMFHDVTGFLYPHLVVGGWKNRLLWSWKSRLARYQADRILTVSDHSQVGLARWFGMSETEISVVGEAADPIFRKLPEPKLTNVLEQAGVRSGRRYLTYLGGFGPNKNLNRLVTAFADIADSKETADVDLVMVGPYENEAFYSTAGDLVQLVKDHGLEERVVFTGFLPDQELVVLFNLSEAVALVSYNEGFGLPAVEAAACGCPCVATLSSPLPGLLGEGGIFVDPLSVGEIKDGLVAVLADRERQARMSKVARKAASELSWQRAAGQMLELLEQLK